MRRSEDYQDAQWPVLRERGRERGKEKEKMICMYLLYV